MQDAYQTVICVLNKSMLQPFRFLFREIKWFETMSREALNLVHE